MAKKVRIKYDDSTLRSNYQADNNGGYLLPTVPPPEFLCDPTHRIKRMVSLIFKIIKNTKDPQKIKTIDALRLKKYMTCYITQYRSKDWSTFYNNRNAPLEHLFNCHIYCDASWCWAKQLDDATFLHLKNKLDKPCQFDIKKGKIK